MELIERDDLENDPGISVEICGRFVDIQVIL